MEFSEWCHSMEVSLSSVNSDGYIRPHSISIIPEALKKSNEDAYTPRAVSIGLKFKGTREHLLLMENIKRQCMTHLFHREQHNMSPHGKLRACCQVIWNLNNQIRTSYVADINLEQHELAKIMLVDGCFLLEVLISKELDHELPCQLRSPSPAAQLLRDEDVLSDLTLLENQIPIFVLHELSRQLFRSFFELDMKERATMINNLVLSVLGYSQVQVQSIESPHILDVVHFFVNGKGGRQRKRENPSNQEHHVDDIINTQQQHVLKHKLKRCAFRLLISGVAIKSLPEDKDKDKDKDKELEISCFNLIWKSLCDMLFRLANVLINSNHLDSDDIHEEVVEAKGLDFYFKFEKGKLEIEQLHVTKTTKSKWCNLIAWEHHKKSTSTSTTFPHGGGGKFTWAALIFNGLICCSDDVQLLKDKKIVVDHLKMSNQELMEFFRTIEIGVDDKVVECSDYIQMVDDMNNYYEASFIERMWKTLRNSIIYHRHDWLLRFMNRNYNFVATVISVLTLVQTVFAILTYYFPKS